MKKNKRVQHQYARQADMTDAERWLVDMRTAHEEKYIRLLSAIVGQLPCGSRLQITFPDGHEHLFVV